MSAFDEAIPPDLTKVFRDILDNGELVRKTDGGNAVAHGHITTALAMLTVVQLKRIADALEQQGILMTEAEMRARGS